jgi:hypothetical protein
MRQKTKALASAAALILQGPFLAFLAHQSLAGYAALSAASGILALSVGASLSRPWARAGARELASMASIGTLAMLVGWFADAGFRPLVGNNICLCGCTDSLAGLGLIVHFQWMQGCMLAACAAVTLMANRDHPVRLGHGRVALQVVASSVLMLAGMAAAGWAMGSLRFQGPVYSLFASYGAMSAGMIAGAAFALRLSRDETFPSFSSEALSHIRWAARTATK